MVHSFSEGPEGGKPKLLNRVRRFEPQPGCRGVWTPPDL